MTPLIDAAKTLLALLDEHHLPPWRTLAERKVWVAAAEDLRHAVEDAEADLRYAAAAAAVLRAALAPAEAAAARLTELEDAAEISYMTSGRGEGETR